MGDGPDGWRETLDGEAFEAYLKEQDAALTLIADHAPLDRIMNGVCLMVESALAGTRALVITMDEQYPFRVFHDEAFPGAMVEVVATFVQHASDRGTLIPADDHRMFVDDPEIDDAHVWCVPIIGLGSRPLGALCVHREWQGGPRARAEGVVGRAVRLAQIAIEHHLSERQVIGLLAAERKQIAADLHDDPVQAVTAVSLILQRLAMDVPAEQAELLGQARSTVNRAIERMRRMLFELHPTALEEDGLAVAVEVYLEETFEPLGISWEIDDALQTEPDLHVDALAYRLIHEALANVVAHAHAGKVMVSLAGDGDGVRATVTDDGCGFDPQKVSINRPGHLGIGVARNLAQRASGRLDIVSAPGDGCTVNIWIPCAPTA